MIWHLKQKILLTSFSSILIHIQLIMTKVQMIVTMMVFTSLHNQCSQIIMVECLIKMMVNNMVNTHHLNSNIKEPHHSNNRCTDNHHMVKDKEITIKINISKTNNTHPLSNNNLVINSLEECKINNIHHITQCQDKDLNNTKTLALINHNLDNHSLI